MDAMDCKKAQRLFDDLAHERLTPETAAHVRRHLAECTDCRVLEQRDARLQRLLSLKRYERPAPQYFDSFLTEFHSRLLAEAQQTGWWERALGRVEDLLAVGSLRMWRYSVASAVGVAAVVGLMWTSVRQPGDSAGQAAAADPSLVVAETMLPPPHSTPSTIAAPFTGLSRVSPSDYQPPTAGSVVLVPTPTRADSPAPRYVLDRIAVTPASYEVASVHF
jgi:hypothetical protein